MKSKPFENSALETECLFCETIEILDSYLNWVYCKLVTDNYHDWIKKNKIGDFKEATHRVKNIRTFIYKKPELKSNIILYLPMGANFVVRKTNLDWEEIYFPINDMIKVGYVPSKHIVEFRHKVAD